MDLVIADVALEEREEATRTSPKLDGLPGEILCMIAREMTNKELRQFREVYNRYITHNIDPAFAEAHFEYRVCKITNRSVNRLERLRAPRFLKHIRTMDFRLDLQCRVKRPAEKLFPEPGELRATSLLNEAKFFAVVESVVRQAPKLRAITIRAPSGFIYTQEGVYIPRSSFLHGFGIRDNGLLRTNLEDVQSNDDAWQVRDFISQLVRRIQVALPCLERFRVVGFAESEWQSNLASARTILEEMAYVPTLRHLNTLDLQLEMFPQDDTRCLSTLVKITKRSTNLKILRVRSGPNVDKNYHVSSEKWAPLLHQLGVDPPFRLEILEIDGLTTSKSAPTLDQIIKAHSPTLRRLILEHTNFHYPNTLRAFFYALVNSNVNYYLSNWLYLHRRTMLVASTLSFIVVPDEVLHSNLDEIIQTEDISSWDWVHITWDIREGMPLVYDNHDGWWGKDWMRDCFLSTISSINSGAIRDS